MRLGKYRHYKGGEYLVVGVGGDANADVLGDVRAHVENGADVIPLEQRMVVIYIALGDRPPGFAMWVRTYTDFIELVCWNGACSKHGKHTDLYGANFPAQCSGCSYVLKPRFEWLEGQ